MKPDAKPMETEIAVIRVGQTADTIGRERRLSRYMNHA
jgi:hypothetical protein